MILHSRTITPGPTRPPGVRPAASPRLKLSRCPGSISADVARYESVAPGLQFAYLSGVDATLNTARQPDMSFVTRALNPTPDEMAPDGSEVRLLARATAGSLAHFTLPAGTTSAAIVHRSVEELWYVTSGAGELWRRLDDHEEVVALRPGVSVSIPRGTAFQFRASGADSLGFVGVTMPPWPGPDEALPVQGKWPVGA